MPSVSPVDTLAAQIGAINKRLASLERMSGSGGGGVSTAVVASGVGSEVSGTLLKVPTGPTTAIVFASITARNDKGSALASADILATIPTGFRPAAAAQNITGTNLSANTPWIANISTAGVVTHSNGSVSNGQYVRLFAMYAV